MDRLDDRSRLKEILRAHSVMRGEFTLASGQKSDIYVDCRLTTLRAEAMPLIGRLLLAAIREKGWRPRAVGGAHDGSGSGGLRAGAGVSGIRLRDERLPDPQRGEKNMGASGISKAWRRRRASIA